MRDRAAGQTVVLGEGHSKSLKLAWRDVAEALRSQDLWRTFAWNDVMARYRRSRIGQFWITLSIAVFVLAIGVFYSQILGVPMQEYLPYLAIGYILWGFIGSIVGEGTTVFVGTAHFLTQLRIPQTSLVLRCVQRNVLIFAHNAVVILGVLIVFPQDYGLSLLALLPGAMLWYLTACWVVMLLGLIAVRFRDIQQTTASVMQIAFFITPVIYKSDVITGNARIIVDFNPFAHYLAILREPLLGGAPDPLSWIVCISITLGGGIITFWVFSKVRSRVPYWL